MKLLRWAVAGASVYAVYRYSIGKKAKGEEVMVNPEKTVAELTRDDSRDEAPASAPEAKNPKLG